MWAHLEEPPPSPSRVKPGLPSELDRVIARGMAKDAAGRYTSASELAREAALALGLPTRLAAPRPPLAAHADRADPNGVTVVPESL
jgi:serine/threonine-protein kinase